MVQSESPTVRRLMLGIRLREARRRAGVSADQAAEHVARATSAISRMELGQSAVTVRTLNRLSDLYQVSDEERETLMALAKQARQRGWWHSYGDVLPAGFEAYIGLEAEAIEMCAFENSVVPGLLQTEDYALALMRSEAPEPTPDESKRRVEARMARQRILGQGVPPRLWAILDEAVLRRVVGGSDVMRDQLAHLVEVSREPHVTIQVLPFARGAHPAWHGPFIMLAIDLGAPAPSEYVYVEYRTGALLLDRQREVDAYRLMVNHLRAEALDKSESVHLIKNIAGELTSA